MSTMTSRQFVEVGHRQEALDAICEEFVGLRNVTSQSTREIAEDHGVDTD